MTTAFVGLGSNVGDRLDGIRRALRLLAEETEVRRVSSIYETDPVGPPQPDFLNAVCELGCDLDPHDLLAVLVRVETDLGRSPGERWGPREIDLDLLLFGELSIDTPDLVVPHPHMLERDFVLVPLLEIAPGVRLPGGERVSEHAREPRGVRRFTTIDA